ncbi:P-loop containing nucleoside triphosphate hydrolase protein [Thozetella sp. PMI_491]|nr:P-loop containing nucleoside triphosphate hydrolase protein [Thozetella sp. PMI_491]
MARRQSLRVSSASGDISLASFHQGGNQAGPGTNSAADFSTPSFPAQDSPEEYKLVLLGDSGVGKTAMVHRLLGRPFAECVEPTIEDLLSVSLEIDGRRCTLKLLDTNGREAVAKAATWAKEQDGILLVYSVTSRESFKLILPIYGEITQNRTKKAPLAVLVANKDDCEEGREVSQQDFLDLAVELGCSLVETSAKGERAVDGVYHLVRKIRRRRSNGPQASAGEHAV